jgi:hypothetical protein
MIILPGIATKAANRRTLLIANPSSSRESMTGPAGMSIGAGPVTLHDSYIKDPTVSVTIRRTARMKVIRTSGSHTPLSLELVELRKVRAW